MGRYCNDLPLSSDAFTIFGIEGSKQHHACIAEAERTMKTRAIPPLVDALQNKHRSVLEARQEEKEEEGYGRMWEKVSKLFHEQGVNLQEMGEVRRRMVWEEGKQVLLLLMIARAVKTMWREWMREAGKVRSQVMEGKLIISSSEMLELESSQMTMLILRMLFDRGDDKESMSGERNEETEGSGKMPAIWKEISDRLQVNIHNTINKTNKDQNVLSFVILWKLTHMIKPTQQQ